MWKKILKVAVSLGLLAFLATRLDWPQVLDRAGMMAWWGLPAAVAIQILIWTLSNFRWWLLIRIHRLGHTFAGLYKPTMIGAFFNNLLPSSTGGDLFRMYHVYSEGHGVPVAVSPIVTERVVGLICLIGLATVAIHFFQTSSGLIEDLVPVLNWLLLAGVAALLLMSNSRSYYLFHRFMERRSKHKLVAMLLGLTEAAHTYVSRPSTLIPLILLSLLLQMLQITVFFILGSGIQAELAATQYLFVVPVVLAIASIPITVGGLGIRETAAVTLFTAAGMGQDDAAAISLLFIPVLLLSGLPGLWFFMRTKGHKKLFDKATHSDFA